MKIEKNKAILTIASIGKLTVKGKTIQSFQIAGNDKIFYNANAKIEKNGTIVVSAKQVKLPVAFDTVLLTPVCLIYLIQTGCRLSLSEPIVGNYSLFSTIYA